MIGPVRFARYSAQELATASDSLLVGLFGDLDRRTTGSGLRRRWRRNKIRKNVTGYRGSSALWTSVRRHPAGVWKCHLAQRVLIRLWRRSSKHLHEPSSEMKMVRPPCLS